MALIKLVEMSVVKDFCNIAQSDTLDNTQLKGMIEQASREVMLFTRRDFEYGLKTEFCLSYDQQPYDPYPQYLWLTAFPLDTTKGNQGITEIVWAPNDMHEEMGATLDTTDYQVVPERGAVIVRRSTGLFNGIIPLIHGRLIFSFAPRGFRVTYWGGYASLNPSPYPDTAIRDPLDDFDVLDVPLGLKTVIARKIAEDWQAQDKSPGKSLRGWTLAQLDGLGPYVKDDVVFG